MALASKLHPVTENGQANWFHTTQWTQVLNAGNANDTTIQTEALRHLCETYWRPVYCYARQHGHGIEDAEDLTQSFFHTLIAKNVVHHADRNRGRFRTFLLSSMKNFLTNEWRRASAKKRGGGADKFSLDTETGEALFLAEQQHQASPEKLYDRSWALTTLETVLEKLRAHYVNRGQEEFYRSLREQLWDARHSTYAEIGKAFGKSEAAVKMEVRRLRQRAQTLLRQEVSRTVVSSEDLELEFAYLKQLLS